jgi:hypothetical protein
LTFTLFLSPALLTRAALYTAGLIGSIAYIGATARSDKYLYLGGTSFDLPLYLRQFSQLNWDTFIIGPLFAGLTVVALSSLAPLVLPIGTAALAFTEAVSLYGGLAVFGGLVLFDTQKMVRRLSLSTTRCLF